jgi:hypothetical protein
MAICRKVGLLLASAAVAVGLGCRGPDLIRPSFFGNPPPYYDGACRLWSDGRTRIALDGPNWGGSCPVSVSLSRTPPHSDATIHAYYHTHPNRKNFGLTYGSCPSRTNLYGANRLFGSDLLGPLPAAAGGGGAGDLHRGAGGGEGGGCGGVSPAGVGRVGAGLPKN